MNKKIPQNAQEAIDWARGQGAEYIDVRFSDMLGTMHHFTLPFHALEEEMFTFGIGIDGGSLRGWKNINDSDMLVRIDPTTGYVDPFFQHKTVSFICDVYEPALSPGEVPKRYNRDPRFILQKALAYMRKTQIADTAFFGPEAEFFIFSDVRFDQTMNSGYYYLDTSDARWNMGRDEQPNLGYKLRTKEGYAPLPPADQFQDLRTEMLSALESAGIRTEKHHHEVSSSGQTEINLVVDEAMVMADIMQLYKYIIKNVAAHAGYSVSFMPKPFFNDNGSGMHTHISLWKNGRNLFAGDKYAFLSQDALHFIAGILSHGSSLLSFTNPTTNSYKRLVPGYEAPVSLTYSAGNRSASIRIPVGVANTEKARRIEFRTPDPAANPYLAFAAIIMAGLDGIEKKLDPGKPADFNLYTATEEQKKGIRAVPANLTKVLDALQKDQDYLKIDGVFDDDFIERYISYKREEVEQIVNKRPHPYEFVLYYDI